MSALSEENGTDEAFKSASISPEKVLTKLEKKKINDERKNIMK
jgi:hypothetical protein